MGVWFRHWSWLTCRRVLSAKRLHRLYATAGAAFMYGPGGWKRSAEVWRQFRGCLRVSAMIPYAFSKGIPWHQ